MIHFYRTSLVLSGVLIFGFLQACAQPRVRRSSPPRVSSLPRRTTPSPSVSAASPKASAPRKPILAESKIREQELGEGRSARLTPMGPPPSAVMPRASGPSVPEKVPLPGEAILKGSGIREEDLGEVRLAPPEAIREEGPGPRPAEETFPTQPEELSLIAMITPETPPQRAASLRLTEEGRKLLTNQEYERGLSKLEKAIAIDSRNRYSYYYLAQAHRLLAHHQQSLNFLEIGQSLFAEEPDWLAKVFALQGKNYEDLGSFERADANYVKALRLDANNRMALQGITENRLQSPILSR